MPNDVVLIFYFLLWYFLIALAILFIISGLDDLFIDISYWGRYLFRFFWKARDYKDLSYAELAAKEEQMIAVLVPCWHEANVIISMLKHNCYAIDYNNYYLFVGVYPNDPDTIAAVESVAAIIKNVQCVIGAKPGPTNKASNLNGIYLHAKEFEKTLSKPFNIFVFHDSEDVIHPLSFKLYNFLIPRKDMIQIPIFPLEVSYFNFTHWLYADEFSENHSKDIIVREMIKAHVPSAGVGTAFSRQALEILENPETHTPFSIDSLTEDYRTSLALRMHDLKTIFVSRSIIRMQWKKRWFGRGYVQKPVREYIATRALFPMEYTKAVRQKARWIIGIVFQEWQAIKWPKGFNIRYTLAHDRKALITHFINAFGYLVFFMWIIYSLLTFTNPQYPSLQEQFNLHPWVWWLIITVTIMMFQRMLQRMIALYRIYNSWIPTLLSIPRTFYGNVLNLHALLRAYKVYYSAPKAQKTSSNQPAWDKTEHHFPGSHILVPYKRRLGDLLLENRLLTPEQLSQAIIEQQESGERLGKILLERKFITEEQFLQLLSSQYNLRMFPASQVEQHQIQCREMLPKKLFLWLEHHGVIPLALNKEQQTLLIAIDDPTNELLIREINNYLNPIKPQFVLIDKHA